MQALDISICNRRPYTNDPARGGAPVGGDVPVRGRVRSLTLPIMLLVLACLSIALGRPSVCRAADYVAIGGDEYDEPGVNGPGWEWRDESTLVLSGYSGCNISIEGDITLLLEGENRATFAPGSACEFFAGVECIGNLTILGGGSLTATGRQAGILVVRGTLAIAGSGAGEGSAGAPAIVAHATGGSMQNATCAGVLADALQVKGGAAVTATSVADAGQGSYGVCVGSYPGAAGDAVVAAPSKVDAEGLTGGFVAAGTVTLDGVGVTLPVGGSMALVTVAGVSGATGAVDPTGAIALHAVVAPGGSGGGAGGTGDGGGSGGGSGGETGAGGSGTTEPTTPGGGSGSGASGEQPTGGEPKSDGKTPAAKAPATPADGNGAKAKASAQPAAQGTDTDKTTGSLPTMGDAPAEILFLALASAAFIDYSRIKARG